MYDKNGIRWRLEVKVKKIVKRKPTANLHPREKKGFKKHYVAVAETVCLLALQPPKASCMLPTYAT